MNTKAFYFKNKEKQEIKLQIEGQQKLLHTSSQNDMLKEEQEDIILSRDENHKNNLGTKASSYINDQSKIEFLSPFSCLDSGCFRNFICQQAPFAIISGLQTKRTYPLNNKKHPELLRNTSRRILELTLNAELDSDSRPCSNKIVECPNSLHHPISPHLYCKNRGRSTMSFPP